MVVTNGAVVKAFPLDNLSKMYFLAVTDVKDIQTNEPECVHVFSVSGVFMGKYENIEQAETELPKGLYVVKSNNGIIQKIAVK